MHRCGPAAWIACRPSRLGELRRTKQRRGTWCVCVCVRGPTFFEGDGAGQEPLRISPLTARAFPARTALDTGPDTAGKTRAGWAIAPSHTD